MLSPQRSGAAPPEPSCLKMGFFRNGSPVPVGRCRGLGDGIQGIFVVGFQLNQPQVKAWYVDIGYLGIFVRLHVGWHLKNYDVVLNRGL